MRRLGRIALFFAAACAACTSGGDYASEEPLKQLDGASGFGGSGWPGDGSPGSGGSAGTVASGGGPAACPNGVCEPGETCASCPQDCNACCGDLFCDATIENCTSCPQDCGGCCPNGNCDNAETCASCPNDCGACCGNGLCDNGENCDSCPGDCGCGECYARCCSNNSLFGPKSTQNGEACKDWGTWATQCGSINNLVRVSFNGGVYWEQPNRCWVLCNNYTVYHLLPGVTSGCAPAGQSHCQTHGGFVDAIWQYCDPS